MSQIHRFISVLRGATANSNLVLNFTAPNRTPAIDFDVTVAILANDSPETIAAKTAAQLITSFGVTYSYAGVPDFSGPGKKEYLFATVLTDHIVALFNQANFQVKVKTLPTDAIVEVMETPIYAKINDVDEMAEILGVQMESADCEFGDAHKTKLLRMSSSELYKAAGEYLVATTYMHQEHGFLQNSMTLLHTPVVTYDSPHLGNTLSVAEVSNSSAVFLESVDNETGVVTFRPSGIVPMQNRVLDRDNFVQMSYVAGATSISEGLKTEVLRAAAYFNVPAIVAGIKGGAGEIKFNRMAAKAELRANLETLGYL